MKTHIIAGLIFGLGFIGIVNADPDAQRAQCIKICATPEDAQDEHRCMMQCESKQSSIEAPTMTALEGASLHIEPTEESGWIGEQPGENQTAFRCSNGRCCMQVPFYGEACWDSNRPGGEYPGSDEGLGEEFEMAYPSLAVSNHDENKCPKICATAGNAQDVHRCTMQCESLQSSIEAPTMTALGGNMQARACSGRCSNGQCCTICAGDSAPTCHRASLDDDTQLAEGSTGSDGTTYGEDGTKVGSVGQCRFDCEKYIQVDSEYNACMSECGIPSNQASVTIDSEEDAIKAIADGSVIRTMIARGAPEHDPSIRLDAGNECDLNPMGCALDKLDKLNGASLDSMEYQTAAVCMNLIFTGNLCCGVKDGVYGCWTE